MRAERKWAKADDYAIRSMSQTRATSKALRLPLGFVMQLAGFDATPADEIPEAPAYPIRESAAVEDTDTIPPERRPSGEQQAQIGDLIAQLTAKDPDVDWKEEARTIAGVRDYKMLTATIADMLIDQLEAKLEEAAAA